MAIVLSFTIQNNHGVLISFVATLSQCKVTIKFSFNKKNGNAHLDMSKYELAKDLVLKRLFKYPQSLFGLKTLNALDSINGGREGGEGLW